MHTVATPSVLHQLSKYNLMFELSVYQQQSQIFQVKNQEASTVIYDLFCSKIMFSVYLNLHHLNGNN